jgi:exopolysaccharide biosynthesis polyprenyl glycosylphosphotransferase
LDTTSTTSRGADRPAPPPSRVLRTRRLLRRAQRTAPAPLIVEAPQAVADVRRRDRLYRRALAISDMASVAVAIAAVAFAAGAPLRWQALLLLPLVVALAKGQGLYDRDELLLNKTTIDEAPQLLQLTTLLALGVSLADGMLLGAQLGDGMVVMLWLALFALVLPARRLTRTSIRALVAVERCVLVGDGPTFERLDAKLQGAAKAELVGRMSTPPPPAAQAADAGGLLDRALHDLLDRTHAHRVIIDPSALPDREMLELVRTAKALGVRVSLLPSVHDVVGSEVVFDQLQGLTLLGVRSFGLSRSSRAVKRSFDLACGALLLLITAPAMLLIAAAIKLDSPGPVFFRQTRVGRGGRHFRIHKFRTMVADAESLKPSLVTRNEAEGLFKIAADPRITRVGRVLRRTSLDELAQLLNVLRGDMSLVGPRPLVVDEDALITGAGRHRLELTPGMTGPWQIAGSSRVPLHEMVKIDYLYVAGWSLWTDIKILLRTVLYMVGGRGL